MTETQTTTKQCPFCAETIQAAAIVCRYCNRDLVEKPAAVPDGPQQVQQGSVWVCSNCNGTVRADALMCKHCKVVFDQTASRVLPAVAPKKGNPIGYIIVTLVVLGALGWLLGLFGGPTTTRGVIPQPGTRPGSYQITYRVGGTARGSDLTYNNAQGGTEQKKVPLPWATSFTARSGAFLYISAQNTGEIGSVACEILVDTVVVKSSKSEGAYKIASCSGRL